MNNELLLSELQSDEKSLLDLFLLIEEFVFETSDTSIQNIEDIIESCQSAIVDVENPLEQVEILINELFVEQMFIDKQKAFWPVVSFHIETSVDYRVVAPTLKAVILQYIVESCGFETDIVYVPDHTMLRVSCDEHYAIIFEPVTGESIDWHQLDDRMDDIEGDPSDIELLPIENTALISEHLTALKNSLIKETGFNQALKCVDLLIGLRPEDPFERRDRGFLLHQLDCFKVAYDDYQYFVEQCPKDPAAQLLKMQLEKITVVDNTLH
ncbi:tetratricopeptide repeat protein [Pseudocolwellia sp. HL-MZ7]|uniref:tetratricopeptide repeat protein n=1 Tax=Pseudocolwellia sp. HL-MZ7 TaxID=3400627 RepID=UPI003CF9E730